MKHVWSRVFIVAIGLLLFVSISNVDAQMTSTNYRIDWDSLNSGGDNVSSSASYIVRDSVGDSAGGQSTSSSYTLDSGYRQGVFDRVATFALKIQDRSGQVAATARSGSVITVTSAAGFSIGDYVALIENEGVSQESALAKISNISGSDITVDFYTVTGSTPTIDGTSDYLYPLDAGSYSFGTFSTSAVSTGVIGWEVDADVADGYGVYVYENQNLKITGGSTLPDVADGAVTAGASEYGARSSDSTLAGSTFDTLDSNITSGLQLVGSRDNNSFKTRDYLTLKASIATGQDDGSYSQTLTFIYVGDY